MLKSKHPHGHKEYVNMSIGSIC